MLSETGDKILEGEAALGNMRQELDIMPAAARAKCQAQFNDCQAALNKAKQDLARSRYSMPKEAAAREALMGESGSMGGVVGERSLQQRDRVRAGLAQLQEDSRVLQDTARIADETAQVGQATLAELDAQRQTINRARGQLRETDSKLVRAGRYIRAMQNRTVITKLITACIILTLVVAIFVVIYMKWLRSSDAPVVHGEPIPFPPPPPPRAPPPPATTGTSGRR